MPPLSPGRRPLAVGLALLAVTAGSVTLATPTTAAPAAPALGAFERTAGSLRAAADAAGKRDLLPRGTISIAPQRGAALRSSGPSAFPAPAPARLTTTPQSTINITFINTAGNAWSDQAKSAFRAAADIWERTIESTVPIEIEATTESLPPGVLGGAGPYDFGRNDKNTTDLRDDVFEPVALFNARTGRDALPPGVDTTGDGIGDPNPDIEAVFNANLGGLYLGTDGNVPADQIDFRTVVMHEIGHGLGLVGSAGVEDADLDGFDDDAYIGFTFPGESFRNSLSYDQFVYATTPAQAGNGGQRVLSLADGSAALNTALTGDALYWSGQLARTANAGGKVELYAPSRCDVDGRTEPCFPGESPFQPGSSFSHLDETVFASGGANGLMTPFLQRGEAFADPGQIGMGMLADMGYAVPAYGGAKYTSAATPVRLLDTRSGVGAATAAVGPGGLIDLQITGRGGVPAGATAVVLNVTGVRPTATTDIRVYPTPVTATPVPTISNLNLVAGVNRANLVTVPIGNNGRVRLRNTGGSVNLLADLAGFYAPAAASSFTALTEPKRILDTRSAIGTTRRTAVPGGTSVDLKVTGVGGVPIGATAVAMTVTGVSASNGTFVTVYPKPVDPAQAPPTASNINLSKGSTVPNVVIVRPDANGIVRLRHDSGTLHLLADVAGYYNGSTAGSLFRPVEPVRILDTRSRLGQPASSETTVGPGEVRTLTVSGRSQLPRLASSAVLNVTGIGGAVRTDVRVYPFTTTTVPTVSNLNLAPRQAAADLVITRLGSRAVKLRNSNGEVVLIADVAGWFGPAS